MNLCLIVSLNFRMFKVLRSNGKLRVLSQSFGFQPDACCCYALAKCEAGEMAIDFKGSHYPKSVILYAVYPYMRYAVSYRDLEEIMPR